MIRCVNNCHLLYRWDISSIVWYESPSDLVGIFLRRNMKVQQGYILDDFYKFTSGKI